MENNIKKLKLRKKILKKESNNLNFDNSSNSTEQNNVNFIDTESYNINYNLIKEFLDKIINDVDTKLDDYNIDDIIILSTSFENIKKNVD